ncbi:hypothetical protein WME88_53920 [Sorangium sp. So ce216]
MLKKVLLTACIRIPRQQLWMDYSRTNPGTKDMILMDAERKLSVPNPSSAEFVPVASLVEKHVSRYETKLSYFYSRSLDLLDLGQVEIATLHVRNTKVWNYLQPLTRSTTLPFRDAALQIGNHSE